MGGLSYTTFSHTVTNEAAQDSYSLTVTNTGNYTAAETILLFAR